MGSLSGGRILALGSLLFATSYAQRPSSSVGPLNTVDQALKAAVATFVARDYANAAKQLEHLQTEAPDNFSVHELLGLVYGAQSQEKKAMEQLRLASRLNPSSVVAKVNLGTCLVRAGRFEEAEAEWRQALVLDPKDYGANRSLAELLLRSSKFAEARPLLAIAHETRPDASDNSYDLALVDLLLKRYLESRQIVSKLQRQHDSGELHNLLGRLDEDEGKFIDAANEFAAAAQMDPSEDNLFVWATELLLHRAYEPAIEVFMNATQRFSASSRLWIGLGMAFYFRGNYVDSVRALLTAAVLSPADARCYLFLSKAYLSSPSQVEDVIGQFRAYANLDPTNALAQYYYAISLWKGRRLESPEIDYAMVESLLKKSIALDDTLAETHLQLGILYADRHLYENSLPEFERALQLNPNLVDAHFRLGRYYLRAGEKDKAEAELEVFKRLRTQHQAEIDKERAEVQQFVVSSSNETRAQP